MSMRRRLENLEAGATSWLERLSDEELETLVKNGKHGDVLWSATNEQLRGIADGSLTINNDGEIVALGGAA